MSGSIRSRLSHRLATTTLRTRLIAVLLTCLTLSCAAVALVSTLALHGFLQDRLDQQLESAAHRNFGSVNRPPGFRPGSTAFSLVVGQPPGTIGAEVIDGQVAAFGVVADSGSGNYAAAQAVIAGLDPAGVPRSVELPGLGPYRVLAESAPRGNIVVTGLPERQVGDTVNHVLAIDLIVFAVAVGVTGLGATGSVRLSLRPLNRVAAKAEEVARLPLGRGEVRMPAPVPNPIPGTEVGHVAVAVNQMIAHVADALRQRHASEDRLRRFVADASHELRTPVAIIRSHAEFAQRASAQNAAGQPAAVGDAAELGPSTVTHSLERIRVQAGRMTALVDDLLLLARLDSGRPLLRNEVDVTLLLLDAVRDAQVAAPQHNWQLELDEDPITVIGDEATLHQAIGNLLANAAAHTPAGTIVTVSLRRNGAAAAIDVVDDGPGIPAQLRPRIFERFVHGAVVEHAGSDDGTTSDVSSSGERRASGGTGLGLPIVVAIVAAHGGQLSLQSRPGYTAFSITLPAQLSDSQPSTRS